MLGEPHVPRLDAAAESYAYWWAREFSIEHDPSQIHGETNHFRYRPRPWHLLRFSAAWAGGCEIDSALIALACQTVGTQLLLSAGQLDHELVRFAKSVGAKLVVETKEELVERLQGMKGGTLRFFGACERSQFSPSAIGNLPILNSVSLANGRIELLNYLKEQSISETVHRYGNLFE
jgi:RHH-type proline utilization regulon transcriptional repressor/proline dehydrogenase/delta 1-pyrroline-5-carboxylate dehydrogenase